MHTSAPLRTLLDVLAGRGGDLAPPLDAGGWASFLAEASRHGVSALAWRGLARCDAAQPAVVHALEGQYVRNRLRNLRLYAHLGPLIEALHDAAIDVVVLKGAFLAQSVYPDAGLRAMSDADLLVREADLERAAHVLRATGWRNGPPLADGGHQLPTFERAGVQVDVHWSIEDDGAPFAIDVAGLWRRAVPARIGRVEALALSAEDLLLHLSLHTAYGHGWKQFDGGLRQLADVAAVVRHHRATLDWNGLVARARAWRAAHPVSLCIATACHLLHAEVPPAVLQALGPPPDRWLALARELALGAHYVELGRGLPVLARSWLDKHWRRRSRGARWRELLLPSPAALRPAYPRRRHRASLMLLAHWNDLAGEVLRIGLDTRARALFARERDRHALIAWLEAAA